MDRILTASKTIWMLTSWYKTLVPARLWQTYGQCVIFLRYSHFKMDIKRAKLAKMAIFESLLDACTPWHGHILAVLNDHSKVNSMDKDLSYGKHMVTMG